MDKFIDSLFYKNYILLEINIKNKIFIMAINSSTKFGVVYTTPEALANKLANDPSGLVSGKLYFAAGATSGAIGQGLYVYNDGSADGDSVGTVAMVGAGSVVDGNHAGLVSPDLFKRWNDASTTADLALVKANQTATALNNYLPKAGGTLTGALTSQNIVPSADSTYTLGTDASRYKTIYADSFVGAFSGTATNATNASTADVAKTLKYNLTINANNVNVLNAWDASKSKSVSIKPGSNITIDASTDGSITIAATDTTYGADRGISLASGKFGHSNSSITPSDTSATGSIDFGETITIPYVKYDTYGHITERGTKSFTMPSNPNTDKSLETDVSSGKVYIVGKASNANNNVGQGYVNSSVYMSGGYLYSGSSKVATEDYVSTQTGAVFNFKGNITALTEISNPKPGYSYRNSSTGSLTLAAANSVSGKAETLETGDIIICTDSTTPKYMVVQNNITNNVNFSATASGELVMFDGTTGTVKNSGITPTSISQLSTAVGGKLSNKGTAANQIYIAADTSTFTVKNLTDTFKGDGSTSVTVSNGVVTIKSTNTVYSHPASISGTTLADSSLKSSTATNLGHGDTFTVATGVYRDASGHISKVATEKFKVPSQYSHPALGTGTTAVDTSVITAATPAHGGNFTIVTGALRDASGHITKVVTQQITLPADNNTDTKVTDSSGTAKSFLLGHASQGSNAAATTNASVYMSGGYLYSGGTKVSVEGHTHSYLSSQTWRPIKINNSQKLANTTSAALDISAGTNISLNWDATNNRVTINASEHAIYWETLS